MREMRNAPKTESMLLCLGYTCRLLRQEERIPITTVAGALGKDPAGLTRFEAGASWPRDIDSVVESYAALTDRSSAAIWLDAVQAFSGEAIPEMKESSMVRELEKTVESLKQDQRRQKRQLKNNTEALEELRGTLDEIRKLLDRNGAQSH